MQEELIEIRDGIIVKSGDIQEVQAAYFRINIGYIELCESNQKITYLSSSRYDQMMERYGKSGDVRRARKLLEKRVTDILNCIKHSN